MKKFAVIVVALAALGVVGLFALWQSFHFEIRAQQPVSLPFSRAENLELIQGCGIRTAQWHADTGEMVLSAENSLTARQCAANRLGNRYFMALPQFMHAAFQGL